MHRGRCGVSPLDGVTENAVGGCSQGKAFSTYYNMKYIGRIQNSLYVVKFRKNKEGNLITQYFSDMEEAEKFFDFLRSSPAVDVEFYTL